MYYRLLEIDPLSYDSILLFGPRGTGKTFWLKEKFKGSLYFDLLDDKIYTELLASPSRLAERIPDNYKKWIIIDEIQKIPALLDAVHRLIEHKGLKFIMTGSSARKLKQSGVNLLAGRALFYYLHALTSIELADDFNLERSLTYGNLPKVIKHTKPEKYLASYVGTYIKQEVLQEGLTRNLPLFYRFLEIASFSQGEVLNYTEISREIGSNRHTVANFFDILEDLLLGVRICVFSKRAKRNLVASPKFYFFDVGVYRSIRPKGPLDSPEEIDGPALETLFLQETRAINDYFALGFNFYYWRTSIGQEVDFILYGPLGLYAFEIKRKSNLNNKDYSGLLLFAKDYPVAKCYMLYGGDEQYFHKEIEVLPFKYIIKNIRDILSSDAVV